MSEFGKFPIRIVGSLERLFYLEHRDFKQGFKPVYSDDKDRNKGTHSR